MRAKAKESNLAVPEFDVESDMVRRAASGLSVSGTLVTDEFGARSPAFNASRGMDAEVKFG